MLVPGRRGQRRRREDVLQAAEAAGAPRCVGLALAEAAAAAGEGAGARRRPLPHGAVLQRELLAGEEHDPAAPRQDASQDDAERWQGTPPRIFFQVYTSWLHLPLFPFLFRAQDIKSVEQAIGTLLAMQQNPAF